MRKLGVFRIKGPVFLEVFYCNYYCLSLHFAKQLYFLAVVQLLSKFSKHRSNSLNKLCMKRWHCVFNTIVKESALKKHFIFHFCIYLRNFVAAFDTIYAFQSLVKLYHRRPSLKANKIYLFTFLVSF